MDFEAGNARRVSDGDRQVDELRFERGLPCARHCRSCLVAPALRHEQRLVVLSPGARGAPQLHPALGEVETHPRRRRELLGGLELRARLGEASCAHQLLALLEELLGRGTVVGARGRSQDGESGGEEGAGDASRMHA
jgi:hypothetical protein